MIARHSDRSTHGRGIASGRFWEFGLQGFSRKDQRIKIKDAKLLTCLRSVIPFHGYRVCI